MRLTVGSVEIPKYQPEGLVAMVLEDWIIPLSLELPKQLLPNCTVSPVQTSCFMVNLIKPKEKSKISCTTKILYTDRKRKKNKHFLRFEWGRGGCWNRKCLTALHPSLNPDVNSSERVSSRQHEVQWARPPGSTRNRLYGKPAALKPYHCIVIQEPFTVSTTQPRPLSSPLQDTDSQIGHKMLFCTPFFHTPWPAYFVMNWWWTGGATRLTVDRT